MPLSEDLLDLLNKRSTCYLATWTGCLSSGVHLVCTWSEPRSNISLDVEAELPAAFVHWS